MAIKNFRADSLDLLKITVNMYLDRTLVQKGQPALSIDPIQTGDLVSLVYCLLNTFTSSRLILG